MLKLLLPFLVVSMVLYGHGQLIEKAPSFPCSFIAGVSPINCCTPMDLDDDGKVNDILFSCYVDDQQPQNNYLYAEILRRNGTWCKKTWNALFDGEFFAHFYLPDYPLLEVC
jgi:hypothetical protein